MPDARNVLKNYRHMNNKIVFRGFFSRIKIFEVKKIITIFAHGPGILFWTRTRKLVDLIVTCSSIVTGVASTFINI